MGSYTNNLFKHKRQRLKQQVQSLRLDVEYIACCAIQRDGIVHTGGHSHSELRRDLGNSPSYEHVPGDIEGFWTSGGRFVDRQEAAFIATMSGQYSSQPGYELISSDVLWWDR